MYDDLYDDAFTKVQRNPEEVSKAPTCHRQALKHVVVASKTEQGSGGWSKAQQSREEDQAEGNPVG